MFGALSQFHAPPLGVMRLAGYLNSKGHYAEYFDPNLYACNKKGLSLEETFAKEKWDIIGFSMLDETLLEDIKNIYLAKKTCPSALSFYLKLKKHQTILDKIEMCIF